MGIQASPTIMKSLRQLLLSSGVALSAISVATANDDWQMRPATPIDDAYALDAAPPTQSYQMRGTVTKTMAPKRSSALRLFTSDPEWRALDGRFQLRTDTMTTSTQNYLMDNERAQPTGLRGVVEASLLNSYEMRAAVKSAEISNTGIWGALAAFTPTVAASLSRSRTESGVTDSVSNSGSRSVTVSVPLFTGGSRFFNLKAAKTQALSSHYTALATMDQVKLDTINSYLQLATLEKAYQIYSSSYDDATALLRATKARHERGFASLGDVALVTANQAATARNLKQTEGDRDRARIELKSRIGKDVAAMSLHTNITHHLPQDVESLLVTAKRKNPTLLAANANYRAQKYSTRASYGQFLPQVSLQGRHQKYFDEPYNGTNAGTDSWTTSVQLNVPLVNLAGVAETVQQRQQTELAILQEAEAFHGLKRDIRALWADYNALSQMVIEAKRERKARILAFKAAQGQYREGFSSLENLLDADSNQQNASLTALQLGVQRDVAAAQLLTLAGTFDMAMLE